MINLKLWLEVLIKPGKTFRKVKNKGSIESILSNLVPAIIFGVVLDLLSRFVLDPTRVGTSEIYIANYIVSGVVSTFLLYAALSYITYRVSRFFQGKGTIKTHFWLISLFTVPMFLLLNLASFIPLGFYSNASKSVIILYTIYLLFLSLKETHSYSSIRSAGTILVLLVLFIIFGFILSILFPPVY